MTNFKKISCIVTLAFLVGCGTNSKSTITDVKPEFQSINISLKTLDAVKQAVRAEMKDPESVKFGVHKGLSYTEVKNKKLYGDVYSKNVGEKVIAVCGKYNAKNSFGGYIGEKLYLAESRDGGDWRVYAGNLAGAFCSDSGFAVTIGGDFID